MIPHKDSSSSDTKQASVMIFPIHKEIQIWVYLVWMLDMDTKAKFLEHSPFRFDDLVLQGNVIPVQNQGCNGST